MDSTVIQHLRVAESFKTAPTILIFSTAMGADYSLELISIVHWVPQIFMHNNSILGGVSLNYLLLLFVQFPVFGCVFIFAINLIKKGAKMAKMAKWPKWSKSGEKKPKISIRVKCPNFLEKV